MARHPGRNGKLLERRTQDALLDSLEHEAVVHPPLSALDVVQGRAWVGAPWRRPERKPRRGPSIERDASVVQLIDRFFHRLLGDRIFETLRMNHERGTERSPDLLVHEAHRLFEEA